jgi:anti-sigma factor RsiW
MARKVSNKELQDFVEGRLSQKDLSRVQAFLRKNPEIENKLEALRKQAETTRNLGKLLLDEPVPPHLMDFINSKRLGK